MNVRVSPGLAGRSGPLGEVMGQDPEVAEDHLAGQPAGDLLVAPPEKVAGSHLLGKGATHGDPVRGLAEEPAEERRRQLLAVELHQVAPGDDLDLAEAVFQSESHVSLLFWSGDGLTFFEGLDNFHSSMIPMSLRTLSKPEFPGRESAKVATI